MRYTRKTGLAASPQPAGDSRLEATVGLHEILGRRYAVQTMSTKKGTRRAKLAPSVARRATIDVPSALARDADRARADILAVATAEFAKKGLSGARVDEIAARTHTVKRMIYYYFGSKEGLYRAVLARCYENIRTLESGLDVDALPPDEALRQLVRVTFDHHNKQTDFVRLVMNENIHHGEHIAHLAEIKLRNRTVVTMLRKLIDRGVAAGVFRPDLDPIELHMSISALSFFNVSNRYTFSQIFGKDMTSPKALHARREVVVDMIERWCRPDH
jgi:AcrR family transcriptional regulator